MPVPSRLVMVALVPLVFLSSACALARTPEPARDAPPTTVGAGGPRVVDLRNLPPLDRIIPRLTGARVVYVGESHDRLDHHHSQLAVIQALHARRPQLAIGMEFFQQPYQGALDDYVARRIDEREMLARTEYYDRWRYDYRLYRPILEYARAKGIPLIALNLPVELTSKAGRVGLDGLDPEERAQVPAEIDRTDEDYMARLRAVFDQHPGTDDQGFDRWVDVQLLWDEGMAERAARYLTENRGATLVVLAGAGHLVHRSGIPDRVARRTGERGVLFLPADAATPGPGLADYLLTSQAERLPPSGRIGVRLDGGPGNGLRVASFDPGSAAHEAGLREGDELIAIDGVTLTRFSDVRIALHDRSPGETVALQARRDYWFRPSEELTFEVKLR